MTTEPRNQMTLEAEALACELVVGLVTPGDVVEWADAWIGRIETPPYALIEVAFAATVHPLDMAHRLRELSGKPRDAAALRYVLSGLGKRLKRAPNAAKQITHALYQMALTEEWADAGIGSRMYSFDDELDLALSGIYGDPKDVTARLQRFLDGDDE